MREKEKIAIFVDGSNFYHGLRNNIGDVDIDFQKFGEILSGKRNLVGIFYYNAPLDRKMNLEKYKKQQKFFEKLRKIPKFNLILVRLQKRKIDDKILYVVKGDDIHIAVDMIMLAQRGSYDAAILVSGDGDFSPAVKAVQSFGKQVENAYFRSGHSWHLREICDKSVLMNKKLLANCIKERTVPPERINIRD